MLTLTGCQNNKQPTQSSVLTPGDVSAGILIHIAQCYDDPHRVLIPSKMATLMAQDKDGIVYMDIHAANLLVKSARYIEFADFESAHTYIEILLI